MKKKLKNIVALMLLGLFAIGSKKTTNVKADTQTIYKVFAVKDNITTYAELDTYDYEPKYLIAKDTNDNPMQLCVWTDVLTIGVEGSESYIETSDYSLPYCLSQNKTIFIIVPYNSTINNTTNLIEITNTNTAYNEAFNSLIADGELDIIQGYFAQIYNYNNGYNRGLEEGATLGTQNGYTNGYTVGYNQGTQDGYNNGYDDGVEVGELSGYTVGYTDGYEEGEDDGYAQGILVNNNTMFNISGLVQKIFTQLTTILNIEVLPGLTLGLIILTPIGIGAILLILRLLRGN